MTNQYVAFVEHSPHKTPDPAVALIFGRHHARSLGYELVDGAQPAIRADADGSGRYKIEVAVKAGP